MQITRKILIVDDEEQSRLYLATIINELHPEISIQLVSSPSEALFILSRENIDLVLLDVEMPGMTGLEMLRKLREHKPYLPVIFISAYKRAEFIQQAIRLDAVDYIDKPVDPLELEQALVKVSRLLQGISYTTVKPDERFCLVTNVGDMIVEPNDITYFCSEKRYSLVFLKDGTERLVRDNLEALVKKLPTSTFLRVGRQYIVNVHAIRFVSKSNKTITIQTGKGMLELCRINPEVIHKLLKDYSLK